MFDENVRAYLNANTRAISALALIICSDEQSCIDTKLQLICVITGSEDAMLDFIDSFGIVETDSFTVGSCLRKLIKINNEILRYTEKLQLQGYKLDKVISALKLENQNIKSELFNVSE